MTNPKFPSLPPLNFQFTIPAREGFIGVPSVPPLTLQIEIDGLDAIEGVPTLADVVREHDRFFQMCRARESMGRNGDKMDDDVFGAAIMRYQNVLNSRSSAEIHEKSTGIQEQVTELQQALHGKGKHGAYVPSHGTISNSEDFDEVDVVGAAIMRYQNVLNSRSRADLGNNTDEVLVRFREVQEKLAGIQEQMTELQQTRSAINH